MRIHLQGTKRPLAVTAATAIAALGIVAPAAAAPADEDRETTAVVDTPAPETDAPAEDTTGEAPAPDETPAVDETESGDADVAPLNTNTEPVTIDILGITDFHGYIENMPYMQTQFEVIRAGNPNTVFVSAGDNIGGSAYISAIAQDVPTLQVLNAMDLVVSAVGNHEFDKGYADLRDRVLNAADFDYLGANVGGAPEIAEPPYRIVNIDGVDVAFVGTVTETTPTIVAADGIKGLTFADPVTTTNMIAAQLKDGNPANGEADVVVSLFHEGSAIAAGMSGDVDLVFSGHTHVTADTTTAAGAPIVQAGQYGQNFAHVKMTVAPDGTVTFNATDVVALDKTVTPNAEIQKIVDDAKAQADELGAEVLATITENAYRGTNNGTDMGANRGTESSMGNHLANAALMTVNSTAVGADFGIINPGGVRADMDGNSDGKVTYAEAFTAQPFGNTIGSIDLTGEQVYTMLEQQFQPGASRPVLRLGLSDNVTYTYNPLAADGGDITGIWIDGVPVDRAATYTVAANTFLLGGQDGFTVFKEGKNLRETGIVDLEGYVNYLRAGEADMLPQGQRSIGLQADLNAGETGTVDLWSLAYTALEEKPTTVTLYLNGTEVGSSAINTDVTPNLDNTGSASVSFAVPGNTPAASQLRIVTTFEGGAVDTDVTVPVHVAPLVVVTPAVPAFADNVIVIPEVEGVEYLIDGEVVEAGTVAITEDTMVTARAVEGYVLADDAVTEWAFEYVAPQPEPTPAPRGNVFYIANDWTSHHAELVFSFGRRGDEVFAGDWDDDGKDTLAVRRGNTFYVNNELVGGNAEVSFDYGRVGDEVLVGDWNDDGRDTFGVRRGNTFYLNNELKGGHAEIQFDYGRIGDQVLVGDWNNDGVDTIMVRRGSTFFVNNELEGGNAEWTFAYGRAGDGVYVGDFDGDGYDTIAVRRGNVFFVNNELEGGPADHEIAYGRAGDKVLIGDWDGDGIDTPAVNRIV